MGISSELRTIAIQAGILKIMHDLLTDASKSEEIYVGVGKVLENMLSQDFDVFLVEDVLPLVRLVEKENSTESILCCCKVREKIHLFKEREEREAKLKMEDVASESVQVLLRLVKFVLLLKRENNQNCLFFILCC